MAARKKLDISKAKVADGALSAPKSVYEMVGIATHDYGKDIDRTGYEAVLKRMNLIELQDEAYKHGVLASDSMAITIDRLVEKFIREHTKYSAIADEIVGENVSKKTRDSAIKALSRGK